MDAILLAREANEYGWIQEREYKNAYLLGPAVLGLGEELDFKRNSFEGPFSSLLMELPDWKTSFGVIGLRQVTFEGCIFRGVSIAGTPEEIEKFRATLAPRQEELEDAVDASVEAVSDAPDRVRTASHG